MQFGESLMLSGCISSQMESGIAGPSQVDYQKIFDQRPAVAYSLDGGTGPGNWVRHKQDNLFSRCGSMEWLPRRADVSEADRGYDASRGGRGGLDAHQLWNAFWSCIGAGVSGVAEASSGLASTFTGKFASRSISRHGSGGQPGHV